ncbi:unnamed protein product [marine sediment metagenome]|uniref:B12-binding domain-containing protein n=1 Tax=marine sediment metagenome TaxID=412755 RepID=X1JGG2_9ZZZZ
MKIALIATPLTDSQYIKSKKWLKVIPRIHPLGLGYIGAYLEQNKYPVKIIDANSENLSYKQIIERLQEFLPDVVGLSATTPAFIHAIRLVKKIRKGVNYSEADSYTFSLNEGKNNVFIKIPYSEDLERMRIDPINSDNDCCIEVIEFYNSKY